MRKIPPFPGRTAAIVILVIGTIASGLIYRESRRKERDSAIGVFQQLAFERHAATREMLVRYEEALAGLWAMFTREEEVSHAEFVRATRRVEDRAAHVQAFEWIPVVAAAGRRATEAAISSNYGGRPQPFTELDAAGRFVPAGERPEYYPIAYIQPLEGNERVLGYDLKAGGTRNELETARRSRRLLATGLVKLAQETGEKQSVIMIWPAYRAGLIPGSEETFLGFVEAILDVRAVLERTRPGSPDNLLDVLFIDGSATDPAKRVLHFLPGDPSAAEAAPSEKKFQGGAVEKHSISFGQRDWQLWYRPRAGWIEAQLTAAPWLKAGGALLVTFILAGFAYQLGRRSREVAQLMAAGAAQLEESRRQLESFMHALPGMAFRCRPGKPLEVLYVSAGIEAITGHPPRAFIEGRVRLRDFVHPDDLDRVRTTTRSSLASRQEFETEYRLLARDGQEKWVYSRGRGVHGPDGSLRFFEGVVIDRTTQKKSEADRIEIEHKLLEGQKLESLGLLAGGIAHDFNNLLTGILGNASLLRMSLPPADDGAAAQLDAIETASMRAADLCRQMLAYAGKGRFVIEPTALSSLVEGMLPLLRISIGRGVKVHLALGEGLPFVMADATQLRQIVMNLVINASDAIGSRGGDIFITTGRITLDRPMPRSPMGEGELGPGEYVFLEVRDTGCGMEAETIRKIFEPFFTTKFAGRGLGLAAVLGIVRSHRGALSVESTPGRGTTFRLLVPFAQDEPEEIPATPTARPWRNTSRVLIIEDDELVRTVAAEALKTYGLSPQLAPNGEAGIAAFKQEPMAFDLVLLDLLMPGLSGEETLAHLRAFRRDVTVLIMSGYNEADTLARLGDEHSRLGFLHKPFTREMLKVKVRALLG